MRVIVVANSVEKDFKEIYHHQKDDYIITTDGSIKEVLDLNLNVDFAVGDFDSGDKSYLDQVKDFKIYPKMKDETDLELALMKVKELNNVDEILIFDAIGGRLDHFLTNLKLITKYQKIYNIKISLVSKDNVIEFYTKGKYKINKDNFKYLSIINFTNTELELSGVVYPIPKRIIKKEDTYTVSNEIVDTECKLNIYSGEIYLIKAN